MSTIIHSGVVGREDAITELKSRLCKNSNGEGRVQVLTAVRGWPGVGKTTLTAVLAHDKDIATAFPDGVLWASLGPSPNLLSKLSNRVLNTVMSR
ncbi:MAG: ATP-binding protein [Chloroflexi bacterium]|nr:ATP-binding protein [Chloroflexota bacterium]